MIYLDTSLVVSLFCPDANSTGAAKAMQTVNVQLLISNLVELEAINAFALKEFRKEIAGKQAEASILNFNNAILSGVFQLCVTPEAAYQRAKQLSRMFTAHLGTRSADILQVATALELGASDFFSFDLKQRKMAEAAGLKLNPWP